MSLVKSIDVLDLKWYSINLPLLINEPYHDQLLDDSDAFYQLSLRVLGEDSIVYEGILLVVFLIVHIEYQRVVAILLVEQLVVLQMHHLELHLSKTYLLVHTLTQLQLLHIIIFIGCIKHGGHIVHVSLLIDTCIDADSAIAQRVHLH